MSSQREGDRISNYLLEVRVGAGSFGEVWRAKHHIFDERVAIKIPTDKQYVRNLQREGVVVHGLRHPNIVRAIDLDPYADPPYLIMEYVDGPSLRPVIDEQRMRFPIPAAMNILRGILQALTAAHDHGLIHRDLKPANILLHQPPNDLARISDQSVKVTDFGLGHVGGPLAQSMMQSGSLLTDQGRSIAGTLAYMSPEQKDGLDLDARSDLYACGILFFELLTGDRPEGSELPSSIRPNVPATLDDLFRRCYTRRERRFTSAREMLAALGSTAPGATSTPPPTARPVCGGCPSCGESVHDDDQFCIHCGTQVVARVIQCDACGAHVHPRDKFCILCGKDLRILNA
jgi:serine/threonine-protein kinase